MKLFNKSLVLICSVILSVSCFSSCDTGLKTTWEDVDTIRQIGFKYNSSGDVENLPVYSDGTSGEVFLMYSLYDPKLTQENLNNLSVKNAGYNICGFEGKLKYASGPVYEYGFIFGVDLDSNSYYMFSLTQNGTVSIYFYNGNASPKGYQETLYTLLSTNVDNPYVKDSVNTVKVETTSKGVMQIYLNNKLLFSIDTPYNPRGTVGIFQQLKEVDKVSYNANNPLVTYYQINKLQRY